MARKDPQINIRVPEETLDKLKIETEKEHRSLTAQVNLLIEEWLLKRTKQQA
ncbi:Arc family DNA-binding protein [Acinetobacter baumannii]|uniref:Arc family DNA-binding protein n=1 Tax=Acinetobacter baumannii TaxID=470 RepID=UPI00112951BE|nr:Arc family DNA-binding protein [Acinetobacter baumannii]EKU1551266.1 Arc family DNA-binding protein [Acinetobacter baumannii]EKU2690944.1 Arc family DNA-binding protein [Acinetobacter baumannii]EKU5255747.1 Arc family DNA-binding protein [Acinetobacter baumannii]EKU6962132.1 Arc family DNA-binding protein [Acinetobacter baumannii]EKU7214362.1 Arc family DNA-binding protein [Acinetobacter baumannii]